MSAPNFSPDLVAIIDREHAAVRDFLDCFPEMSALVASDPRLAMFGRQIVLDCLRFARDPNEMMYRLAGWERLTREHGG